jgi:hypothetical protein
MRAGTNAVISNMCTEPEFNPETPAVSSLIFTLAADPAARAAGLDALSVRGDLMLGDARGRWVPAVLESNHPLEVLRELESLAGVELVEVVFVEVPPVTTS